MRSLRLAVKQSLKECGPNPSATATPTTDQHSRYEPRRSSSRRRPKRIAVAAPAPATAVSKKKNIKSAHEHQAQQTSKRQKHEVDDCDNGNNNKKSHPTKQVRRRCPQIPPPPGQSIQYVRNRRKCSSPGCTRRSACGGVCIAHGATQTKKKCRVDGCGNFSILGGICVRHGAKLKRCSAPGCTNGIMNKGVCRKHGGTKRKCKVDGCVNITIQGGVCKRHGAKCKKYICKVAGCTKLVNKFGKCCRHGVKAAHKNCSVDGCPNLRIQSGVCHRHGARTKCSHEGCTNCTVKGGVCIRHGANKPNSKPRYQCSHGGCTSYSQKKGWICARHGSREEVVGTGEKKRRGRSRGVEPVWQSESSSEEEAASKKRKRPQKKKKSASVPDQAPAHKKRKRGCPSSKAATKKADEPVLPKEGGRRQPPRRVRGTANINDSDDNSSEHDSGDEKSVVYSKVRTMHNRKQRRNNVARGIKVKVRFDGNVRYVGIIDRISKGGSPVNNSLDAGMKETSDFLDRGDVRNSGGRHRTDDAAAFVPRDDSGESFTNVEDGAPTNVASMGEHAELICQHFQPHSSISNSSVSVTTNTHSRENKSTCSHLQVGKSAEYDSEEEEELGALIYKSSRTARSIAGESGGRVMGAATHVEHKPTAVTSAAL